MPQTELPFLPAWQNFFMIVGTASATLTGLMFVSMTLISSIDAHLPTMNAGISAFNTPTVFHFAAVLVLASILSAPWTSISALSLCLGLLGLGAGVYMLLVIRRMRQVPGYQTPVRDWVWYMAFPLGSYMLLVIAALNLGGSQALMLYLIAGVMIVLLMTGIHNAWDLVSYLAVDRSHPEP